MRFAMLSHSWQDYGPRMLAGELTAHGHQVRKLILEVDQRLPLEPGLVAEVVKLCADADVVGFSVYLCDLKIAIQLTQALKAASGQLVVWGGPHPTSQPEEAIQYADVVFLGEAEASLNQFMERLANDPTVPTSVKGTWVRAGATVHRNGFPDLIGDLDTLAFPHYDLPAEFLVRPDGVHPIDATLFHAAVTTYYAYPTRGCPHKCTYCINNLIASHYHGEKVFRTRNMDLVIEEIRRAVRRSPNLTMITLADDAFLGLPIPALTRFCEQYKSEIRLPLRVTGATPATVTQERIQMLVDAGLVDIRMGIQTGSETIRKLYKRTHSRDAVRRAAKVLKQFADRVPIISYDIIVDNPWETEQDKIDTLMLLAEFEPPFYVTAYSLTFFPGTELYDKALDEGKIAPGVVYPTDWFYCYENTYLNSVLLTLRRRAQAGRRFPPWLMRLVTSRALRRAGLAQALYGLALNRNDLPLFAGQIRRRLGRPLRALGRTLSRWRSLPYLPDIDQLDQLPVDRPFYFYGAGGTAALLLAVIRQNNIGAKIAGFIDSSASGSFHGFTLYRLDEFAARFDHDETIIIASQCVNEIHRNLLSYNFKNIQNAYPLFKKSMDRLIAYP